MRKLAVLVPVASSVAIICALNSEPVGAQSAWARAGREPSLSLQLLKPQFADDNPLFVDPGFTSSALFVSGRFPLSRRTRAVVELPLAYGSTEFRRGDSESSLVAGNPYIGLEAQPWHAPVTAELGVRLPVAGDLSGDDFATGVGIFADPDRVEAFVRERAALVGMLNYRQPLASVVSLQVRGGAIGLLSTSEELYRNAGDLVLSYAAILWYEPAWGAIGGGFTGRWGITDEERAFRDQAVHQIGAVASLTRGKLQPNLQFRLPLSGDPDEILDFVFGVGLQVNLR